MARQQCRRNAPLDRHDPGRSGDAVQHARAGRDADRAGRPATARADCDETAPLPVVDVAARDRPCAGGLRDASISKASGAARSRCRASGATMFPQGVPGVPQGVPPDLVQGYQPPPETAAGGRRARRSPSPRAASPRRRARLRRRVRPRRERARQQQQQAAASRRRRRRNSRLAAWPRRRRPAPPQPLAVADRPGPIRLARDGAPARVEP